ncbi:transcriptional regulator, AraC family [bacterium A37T11]|nr:transcriptional regulator, AraC family [bacterium A37T11]
MKLHYYDHSAKGELHLTFKEERFDRLFFPRDRQDKFLTIAWNNGDEQHVNIDGVNYVFPAQSVLPLMVNQSFTFEKSAQIVAWQFNRDFYCIVDHDKEVGCVGFLFYGSGGILFARLDKSHQRKIKLLQQVFVEELNTHDHAQRDMLQMLLKRLIIIVTRLGKQQNLDMNKLPNEQLDILRKYNLMVENNFKKEHSVKFYADSLYKSPKTLANYFALYNQKSPLAVIQERIILEAKRLLLYTDKSAKEIAYELGYDDAGHFSNFFKKQAGLSPTNFKRKNL